MMRLHDDRRPDRFLSHDTIAALVRDRGDGYRTARVLLARDLRRIRNTTGRMDAWVARYRASHIGWPVIRRPNGSYR
jgi:hypothetical protein